MKTVLCSECHRTLPVKRTEGLWWWLTADLCPVHPTGGLDIRHDAFAEEDAA